MMKRLFFLLVLSLALGANEIEIYLDWQSDAKGEALFLYDEATPENQLSLLARLKKRLLERNWEIKSWDREAYRPWLLKWGGVETWEEFVHWLGLELPRKEAIRPETDFWVFWSLGPKVKDFDFSLVPKEKMILFAWEPPTVQKESHDSQIWAQFNKVFTWDDDLVDGVKFIKFHYPVLMPRIHDVPPFEEKNFCVLVNRRLASPHPKELYSEREKTIRFFEDKPGEFDLFGYYWEKRGYKNWKGPIKSDKIQAIKNYKYCICYENMRDVKGYVTEKIFDCFAAGVVPVYWGASNIADYVPKESFIDRRSFSTQQEMYDFLCSITKEEYSTYLEAAEAFLHSEKAQKFSPAHFETVFLSILN